jgi:uncharacterized membrane protein YhhN
MGIVYLIVLAIHLFAICLNDDTLMAVSKPLLMVSLLMFFYDKARFTLPKVKYLIFGALLFSLLGDVLLLFNGQGEQFFIFGLVAFLVAHICYIYYFRGIARHNGAARSTAKLITSIPAVLFTLVLLWILFPKLGNMKIPVLAYATVICCMMLSVIYAFAHFRSGYSILCMFGAALFAVSDSILAYNKFHTPFVHASWLIMLTYGLAQLLLVWGSIINLNRVPDNR